jgi:hypothetical protein
MKTAMQELMQWMEETEFMVNKGFIDKVHQCIEKEKEQIKKAFLDGQETPINHPTLPHYSNEEYFNDNYNQNK